MNIQFRVPGVGKYLSADGLAGAAGRRAEFGLHLLIGVVIALLNDKVDRRTNVEVLVQVMEVTIQVRILNNTWKEENRGGGMNMGKFN